MPKYQEEITSTPHSSDTFRLKSRCHHHNRKDTCHGRSFQVNCKVSFPTSTTQQLKLSMWKAIFRWKYFATIPINSPTTNKTNTIKKNQKKDKAPIQITNKYGAQITNQRRKMSIQHMAVLQDPQPIWAQPSHFTASGLNSHFSRGWFKLFLLLLRIPSPGAFGCVIRQHVGTTKYNTATQM